MFKCSSEVGFEIKLDAMISLTGFFIRVDSDRTVFTLYVLVQCEPCLSLQFGSTYLHFKSFILPIKTP